MKTDKVGWVYFIGSAKSDMTKIGFSTRPKSRLSQVQSGNAERLAILYAIPATKADEAWLHEALAPARRVGEWFAGADFVRLVGEQIMALHFARVIRRMGLEWWPHDAKTESELYRRARASKVMRCDLGKAIDMALEFHGA